MVLGTRRLRGRRPGRGAARLVGVDLGHLFSSVVCSRGLPFDLRSHGEGEGMQICEIKCGVARTARGSDLRAKLQSFESYRPGGRTQEITGRPLAVARAASAPCAIDATLAIRFCRSVFSYQIFT